MKVETLDLHGLSVNEALEKTQRNISWCLKHGVDILDINHGKGYHSSRNFSVLKLEIRKMMKESAEIAEYGYRVIFGESDLPIALTYDEGHTLLINRGLEQKYLGGKKEQEKNIRIFSEEGKKQRKEHKSINAQKRKNR